MSAMSAIRRELAIQNAAILAGTDYLTRPPSQGKLDYSSVTEASGTMFFCRSPPAKKHSSVTEASGTIFFCRSPPAKKHRISQISKLLLHLSCFSCRCRRLHSLYILLTKWFFFFSSCTGGTQDPPPPLPPPRPPPPHGQAPALEDTDAPKIRLYSVSEMDRTVEAAVVTDIDAFVATGSCLADIVGTVVSPNSSVILHSTRDRKHTHENTRIAIKGDGQAIVTKLYGKKVQKLAITKFKNNEICTVRSGSIVFRVSAYVVDSGSTNGKGYFPDKYIHTLNCAFNLARIKPGISRTYKNLIGKASSDYEKARNYLTHFDGATGKKERTDAMSDTVRELAGSTGATFMAIVWDILLEMANLQERMDEMLSNQEDNIEELLKPFTFAESCSHYTAEQAKTILPAVAILLTRHTIYSARAVGTKCSLPDKPSSMVELNDEEELFNVLGNHVKKASITAREYFTQLASPQREVIYSFDIAHEFSPSQEGTSFLSNGFASANYSKRCRKVQTEVASSHDLVECDTANYPPPPSDHNYDAAAAHETMEIGSLFLSDAAIAERNAAEVRREQEDGSEDEEANRVPDISDRDFLDALLAFGRADNDGQDPGQEAIQELPIAAPRDPPRTTPNPELTDEELINLLVDGLRSSQFVFPGFLTDGTLGNAHTGKTVHKAEMVRSTDPNIGFGLQRIKISIAELQSCIQGMQVYVPSVKNDFLLQTRQGFMNRLRSLSSDVAEYMSPMKTEDQKSRMPTLLAKIRLTLKTAVEILENVLSSQRYADRQPVRFELFYFFDGNDFFEEAACFPRTPGHSPAECIFQVHSADVYRHHHGLKHEIYEPVVRLFGTSPEVTTPPIDSLDAQEMTMIKFCTEVMTTHLGCFGCEGTIQRALRIHQNKSKLNHQPNIEFRLPASNLTFSWTGMRYKLKASLYPCKYGDEGPAGMDPSNWEKEQKKLERDIALQLRKVVRVPDAYARGKAAIMNTFHQYSHLGGTEDPTSPGVPSTDIYGYFDHPNFFDFVGMQDASRKQFLTLCVSEILKVYAAEWRDILNMKMEFNRKEMISAQPARTSYRRRMTQEEAMLPDDLSIPTTIVEYYAMTAGHAPSRNVVEFSTTVGSSVVNQQGENECVFLV
jgi:hypothetical protein